MFDTIREWIIYHIRVWLIIKYDKLPKLKYEIHISMSHKFIYFHRFYITYFVK